jgi:hypothetical protein
MEAVRALAVWKPTNVLLARDIADLEAAFFLNPPCVCGRYVIDGDEEWHCARLEHHPGECCPFACEPPSVAERLRELAAKYDAVGYTNVAADLRAIAEEVEQDDGQ